MGAGRAGEKIPSTGHPGRFHAGLGPLDRGISQHEEAGRRAVVLPAKLSPGCLRPFGGRVGRDGDRPNADVASTGRATLARSSHLPGFRQQPADDKAACGPLGTAGQRPRLNG